MDCSLRELECFTAVAEELSFTRAARRLNLAQPPLSRHIRSLEDKIGGRLFDRSGRSVAITEAGHTFFKETRGLLHQLTRAGELARRSANGESERLNLGFVSAVGDPGLVEAVRKHRDRFPSVQIMLHDSSPADQIEQIKNGSLNGGFIGLMPDTKPRDISFIPWRTERLVCFLPSGHRLSSRRRISLMELADESFVAVSNAAAPAFSSLIHKVCVEVGYRPKIILESPRAQAVAVMVAAGSGVALLPETLVDATAHATCRVRLKEDIEITHVFAHATGQQNEAMNQFIKCLK